MADFKAQELRALSLFSSFNDDKCEQFLSRHLQSSHGPDQMSWSRTGVSPLF